MEDLKVYGHYYKKLKLMGIRKITIVDITEEGKVTFVFGHVTPGEADRLNKMECFRENVIPEVPADVKAEIDAWENKKREEAAEKKRIEREEAERKSAKIEEFIAFMDEHGVVVSEANASWLTPEQMDQAMKDVAGVQPEEGFMLF